MEYNPEGKEIMLKKELNNLDMFVVDFCKLLSDKYVIVSGYVSILLGRSRGTEDVDLLMPTMDYNQFKELWDKIHKNQFECVNTENSKEAFELFREHNIRFSKRGTAVPNMEFKMARKWFDEYSLKDKIKVKMGQAVLFISPLEMQIAYKLNLSKQGNNKDLEDAKHLYELFGEKINKDELNKLIGEFGVKDKLEIIKKDYGNKYRRIK